MSRIKFKRLFPEVFKDVMNSFLKPYGYEVEYIDDDCRMAKIKRVKGVKVIFWVKIDDLLDELEWRLRGDNESSGGRGLKLEVRNTSEIQNNSSDKKGDEFKKSDETGGIWDDLLGDKNDK